MRCALLQTFLNQFRVIRRLRYPDWSWDNLAHSIRLIYCELVACIQLRVGGLESLLWIASLPFQLKSVRSRPVHVTDLVVESCRALASLSPLLLTEHSVDQGYASWACDVLKAFVRILKYRVVTDENGDSGTTRELQFDSLRGITALADFEPFKLLIVDELLPHLLQMKKSQMPQIKCVLLWALQIPRLFKSQVTNQNYWATGFVSSDHWSFKLWLDKKY